MHPSRECFTWRGWSPGPDGRRPSKRNGHGSESWAESDAKASLERVEQRLREGELAGLNLSITTSVAVHADAAETLMRMAEHATNMDDVEGFDGCDLIALATHGRGGLQRWAVGSVTERLLGATSFPCSLCDQSLAEIAAKRSSQGPGPTATTLLVV